MGIFEENFFLYGVEDDEASIDIPQHIGEDAGGIAEGVLRQGRVAVFAVQYSAEEGLYQETHHGAEGNSAQISPMVADFEAKASAAEIFSIFIVERGPGSRLYCACTIFLCFPV